MARRDFPTKELEVNVELIDDYLKKKTVEFLGMLGLQNTITQNTNTFDREKLKETITGMETYVKQQTGNYYMKFKLRDKNIDDVTDVIRTDYNKQIEQRLNQLIPIVKAELGV